MADPADRRFRARIIFGRTLQATAADCEVVDILGPGYHSRVACEVFVKCVIRTELRDGVFLLDRAATALFFHNAEERRDAGPFAKADAVRRFAFVEGHVVAGR